MTISHDDIAPTKEREKKITEIKDSLLEMASGDVQEAEEALRVRTIHKDAQGKDQMVKSLAAIDDLSDAWINRLHKKIEAEKKNKEVV